MTNEYPMTNAIDDSRKFFEALGFRHSLVIMASSLVIFYRGGIAQ